MTYYELYMSFPEPYRTRAIENMDPEFGHKNMGCDLVEMLNNGADIYIKAAFKPEIKERNIYWIELQIYYKVKSRIEKHRQLRL